MKKEIFLKNLNYITAGLWLLLSLSPVQAINWRIDRNRIWRPQWNDAADDALVPVRFGREANPLVVVKADARSLPEPVRPWLSRLRHDQPPAFFVIYNPVLRTEASVTLYCGGLVGKPATTAIKFLPLPIYQGHPANGQIFFDIPADQREGIRVQSLPNGFLRRELPYAQKDDAWWRVRLVRNNPNEAFAFATLIVLPNDAVVRPYGNTITIVGIIPPAGFMINVSDPATIGTFAEPLLRCVSHPNCPCFADRIADMKKHFFGDKNPQNFSRTPLTRGEILGQGCFGQVYAGKAGNRDVVIKTGLDPRYQADMEIEFNRSEELREAVAQRADDFMTVDQRISDLINPNGSSKDVSIDFEREIGDFGLGPERNFAKFQGFGGVVMVLGRALGGSIVQEKIDGGNLFNAVQNGFPRNLQTTKQIALELAAEIMSMHTAGIVHRDIKSNNLMLDQQEHIHVIDLGVAKKVGEAITASSLNGGPECILMQQQLTSIGARITQFQSWHYYYRTHYAPLQAEAFIRDLNARCGYEGLCRQYESLNRDFTAIKADPAYDIYSEGSVLPGIFFGKAGFEWSEGLNGICSLLQGPGRYLQETADMSYEARMEYFQRAFTGLNGQMRAVTGQGYSETEIQKMSALMAWMMDPNPSHRPTSEQVFTHLMELNNISTAEEENIKAGQKYRSEHPQSLGVDATKRASSFRRYWRQSGKK